MHGQNHIKLEEPNFQLLQLQFNHVYNFIYWTRSVCNNYILSLILWEQNAYLYYYMFWNIMNTIGSWLYSLMMVRFYLHMMEQWLDYWYVFDVAHLLI